MAEDNLANQAQMERRLAEQDREIERLMRERQAAQEHLVQLERLAELGKMLAGISHELNNPLGRTLGNASVLSTYVSELQRLVGLFENAATLPPELAEAFADLRQEVDYEYIKADLGPIMLAIQDGVQRAVNIISTFRLFVRDTPALDRVDPKGLCEEAIRAAQADFRHKAIEVVRRFGDGGPIVCSPMAMQVVLTNLIVNAADAIADSGRIEIEITRSPCRCLFRVEDSGQGIAPHVLPRVFEPFFSTKPPGQSMGLGLALCKTLVSRHGGSLTIESTVGKGTQATIDIPVEPPRPAPSDPAPSEGGRD